MNKKNGIYSLAFSSIISALIAVILIAGAIFDLFDLVCASATCLLVYVTLYKFGYRYAFGTYICGSVLSFIFVPFTSACLYFFAFFGYYTIIRTYLKTKVKNKKVQFFILLILYNAAMSLLYLIFKGIFGIADEPLYMILMLLFASNLFFICFDILLDKLMIICRYKFKKTLNPGGKHDHF